MGEKRESYKNLWYYGALYFLLIGLWWIMSAGWFGFENSRSYNYFAVIMINKTGLAVMLFTGRYLLFPENRAPRVFGWTLGSLILAMIAMKIWIHPGFSLGIAQLAECGDGLIWCLIAAWSLELAGAIYLEWGRVPFTASALPGLKRRAGATLAKLGLFSAGAICFLELYWLNVSGMEITSIGYWLLIPLLGVGMGLYGVFSFRMNRWIEERIGAVDEQLLGLWDWEMGGCRKSLISLTPGEIERTQILLLWRWYLKDLKKAGLVWWALVEYLVLSGLIISLPYWMKAVVEV
ncbi:MAG: hypothetical protein K6U80_00230 [Firmicutes bacterium]|nr:hypothetical protein [Bacillota bacterium]